MCDDYENKRHLCEQERINNTISNFLKDPCCHVLGKARNKLGEQVVAVVVDDNRNIEIFLYGAKYSFASAPSICCTKKRSTDGEVCAWIDDISSKGPINVGNGSLLMDFLIQYLEEKEYASISGELSYVDKDHFKRLEAFYRKHGFIVSYNDDGNSGAIFRPLGK